MRSRLGIIATTLLMALVSTQCVLAAKDLDAKEKERCRKALDHATENLPLPFLPTDGTRPVYLKIKGTRYAIPANYFRYPPIGCDTGESGFSLRALLPTLEGYSKEKDEAFRGIPLKPYDGLSILMMANAKPNMDRTFGAFARGADSTVDHPTWQGLLKTRNRHGSDVFFRRSSDSVEFLMVCKTKKMVNYPGCDLLFAYRGGLVKLHMQRHWLSQWQSIFSGSVALLDKFVMSASE